MSDLEVSPAYDLSSIGLRLVNPNLTIEDFSTLCGSLGEIYKIVRFAIGDAIIQGEELYGAEAYQAFEEFNLSEDGMQEYRRVSARVPQAVRRPELSWSHHRAVASLELPEQQRWLERASEQHLSHHALRDELRNGAEPQASSVCRCCGKKL